VPFQHFQTKLIDGSNSRGSMLCSCKMGSKVMHLIIKRLDAELESERVSNFKPLLVITTIISHFDAMDRRFFPSWMTHGSSFLLHFVQKQFCYAVVLSFSGRIHCI
jgi:hypothetical protein